jgi:hypothetical protein
MVKKTRAQHQAEYLKYANDLFEYAVALDDDDDDDIPLDDEDFGSDSDNDLSEVLELSALHWTQIALALSGDGSRGPYNQFQKSSDFLLYLCKHQNDTSAGCFGKNHIHPCINVV